MDERIWIHLIIGPLMLVLALLFRKFPPKKINDLYGYRTARSMKSEEAWVYANRYSANGLLVVALCVALVQISLYFLLDSPTVLLLAAGFLIGGLIALIVLTEQKLKSKGF